MPIRINMAYFYLMIDVKYQKAFVYLWEYLPSLVCVNQLKGGPLTY